MKTLLFLGGTLSSFLPNAHAVDCPLGTSEFKVSGVFDQNPSEVSWSLWYRETAVSDWAEQEDIAVATDQFSDADYSGSNFDDAICVPTNCNGGTYQFTMSDYYDYYSADTENNAPEGWLSGGITATLDGQPVLSLTEEQDLYYFFHQSVTFPACSDLTCDEGEEMFELDLQLDAYYDQTAWKLEDEFGNSYGVMNAGDFTGAWETNRFKVCLPASCDSPVKYTFTIADFAYYDYDIYDWVGGDGLDTVDDIGNFELTYGGNYIDTSADFDFMKTVTFDSCISCGGGQKFEMDLQFGYYTGYFALAKDGVVVYEGEPVVDPYYYNYYQNVGFQTCLSECGTYTFTLNASDAKSELYVGGSVTAVASVSTLEDQAVTTFDVTGCAVPDISESPSTAPSIQQSAPPTLSVFPSSTPSETDTDKPSISPSVMKSMSPSSVPSSMPSVIPSSVPSSKPSETESSNPSGTLSSVPSITPSDIPSSVPSITPSGIPSSVPSLSSQPTLAFRPSDSPSLSAVPSALPSFLPSLTPSITPSDVPSTIPSSSPSFVPSSIPSEQPSGLPSMQPSDIPSTSPSSLPSSNPSVSGSPSALPSVSPSALPSVTRTEGPSGIPSASPSDFPSVTPSELPSADPSQSPSDQPSSKPSVGETFVSTLRSETTVTGDCDKKEEIVDAIVKTVSAITTANTPANVTAEVEAESVTDDCAIPTIRRQLQSTAGEFKVLIRITFRASTQVDLPEVETAVAAINAGTPQIITALQVISTTHVTISIKFVQAPSSSPSSAPSYVPSLSLQPSTSSAPSSNPSLSKSKKQKAKAKKATKAKKNKKGEKNKPAKIKKEKAGKNKKGGKKLKKEKEVVEEKSNKGVKKVKNKKKVKAGKANKGKKVKQPKKGKKGKQPKKEKKQPKKEKKGKKGVNRGRGGKKRDRKRV